MPAMTDRAALDALDRDALVARAEALGLARARVLTRPELVDEILLRTGGAGANLALARGLFGLARDLLARVVERGLNRPDAADRIRALGIEAPGPREAPGALPTVTLAEIYVRQGHVARARATLRAVLEADPSDDEARSLLETIERPSFAPPAPVLPPEPEGDAAAFPPEDAPDADADAPPPASAPRAAAGPAPKDVPPGEPSDPFAAAGPRSTAPPHPDADDDTCVVAAAEGGLFVRFDAPSSPPAATSRARLVVRAHLVVPSWSGVEVLVTDRALGAPRGSLFVPLERGGVARAAVGVLAEDGTFVPFAHSDAVELGDLQTTSSG